ncbi:MAG TPA: zf-HC2 domain-containing protein [Pyrinomonadaceae bacterium]|nr:zf-HC2 domain-containing protein [Pyrinomonadaceae bacterium]
MSCNFTEKVSLLIDGELAPAEAREVEGHLLNCVECELMRADFLSLRSQIAGFATATQPVVQNRALKKILSGGRRAPARGLQWAWGTPAVAFAVLLIVAAITGFLIYKNSNKQESIAKITVPTPTPTATPEPPKPEEPKETETPKRTPSAPAKKPITREPKPGEQFATLTLPEPPAIPESTIPERVKSADSETLTAMHFERSETLLRAFRNVRLNEPTTAEEVAYERKRAQQLVYQNMILRREADAAGDVQTASLLESLEPILLDIANLPDKPKAAAVRVIRERVERKNIVALLQVNSTALARALD